MIGHIGTQDCRNRKRAKKHIIKNSKLPLAATSACLEGGGGGGEFYHLCILHW